MRIHVVQTGTVAIKQVQRHGRTSGTPLVNILRDSAWTEPLPIYAFLIEHPEGLIVVDTGETARVAERGYFPWWHPYFHFAVREWVQPEEEIGPQMRALGFDPRDVRWVLLTHLHTDHAGGLAHFPNAEHLLARREYHNATGARLVSPHPHRHAARSARPLSQQPPRDPGRRRPFGSDTGPYRGPPVGGRSGC
jgi:N-acyl homoserine lactone hydrolase